MLTLRKLSQKIKDMNKFVTMCIQRAVCKNYGCPPCHVTPSVHSLFQKQKLNSRCPNSRNWYLVIDVLHQEAKLLTRQTQLLSRGMLEIYQRKAYKDTQGRIFKLWDDYGSGKKSTSQLLHAASRVYSPPVPCLNSVNSGNK